METEIWLGAWKEKIIRPKNYAKLVETGLKTYPSKAAKKFSYIDTGNIQIAGEEVDFEMEWWYLHCSWNEIGLV